MSNIQDHAQRKRALDPQHSFIVQAPAGSGKTELLTQRFLVLLSCVKQPEEILAITFTKKSAAEMRARIINALKKAAHDPEPSSEHEKQTWQLAKKALHQNDHLQWDLLENPSRLRIQTIDSFNSHLTRQLPILSHFGATPDIANDPSSLYREAVQEFLAHLEENLPWSDAIAQLLLHMDNDLNKVETLLINLLAKRDQWLHYITPDANDPELRKKLEKHLASIVEDALQILHEQFPKKESEELVLLANTAAHHLLRQNSSSAIVQCADLTALPGTHVEDKTTWIGLSELLLTKDFEWRKRFDVSLGFPSPSACKNPEEKKSLENLKKRATALTQKLSENEKLRLAFEELRKAPDPHYKAEQWETLHSLHQVLRIAVAQLKLTFQKYHKIDYIENAQAALTALGTDDHPTDLTLALDYKIQHILIDEFQDTSTSQFRLLEKLIAGWEHNDGRTLFIVGDPMQSIYRFREAEVGLFIRSRKIGIGHIPLEPLTLSVNFRSIPGIVDWVNTHFEKVFPPFEDIATGAVSYSASMANKSDRDETSPVSIHPFIDIGKPAQSEKIISLVQHALQKNPHGSIAILVRSRTSLEHIIPALKKARIPYRAIDIDPLTARPVIQDLIALTKALLQPTDRISWLAILRAPWCGMTLEDLLIIAGQSPEQMIWERLQDNEVINSLQHEAKQRLARTLDILKIKITERQRHTLRYWIESTWTLLGGPACLDQETELQDAAAFFELLEQWDEGGDLSNVSDLDQYVSQLFAAPNTQAEHPLQIMTIHNAKGLEFDTVILPHLERKSPNDDKQLLLWMERSRQKNNALILAPVHAIGQDNDSIYDYIKRQHAIKMDYETGRLLYVAATRAKKEMHLLFHLDTKEKSSTAFSRPASKSLLEKIWDPLHKETLAILSSQIAETIFLSQEENKEKSYLKRLSPAWTQPLSENNAHNIPAYQQKQTGLLFPDTTAQHVGVFIHALLQRLYLQGKEWWTSQDPAQQKQFIKNHLIQAGVLFSHLSRAVQHVLVAIENTLQDPRGQWILAKHQDCAVELKLTSIIQNNVKQLVLDRTFIDEVGTRWIIDYKTTSFHGDDLKTFLENEKKEHEPQLYEYYLAMREKENRSVRLGLYFPMIPAWYEWGVDGFIKS